MQAGGSVVTPLREFVQRLALRLASWESTTFLVGEYAEADSRNPVFTIADGILWLMNEVERNSTQRRIRVTKTRGQAALPGLHTFRITDSGLQVYPRFSKTVESQQRPVLTERLSIGVPGLDSMMNGGIPAGDSPLYLSVDETLQGTRACRATGCQASGRRFALGLRDSARPQLSAGLS
jgi:circadian clock protein KaiC